MMKKYSNQEHEVIDKLNEYNKDAGYNPLQTETVKYKVEPVVIDQLLESANKKESYEYINLYRKTKKGIVSITVKRDDSNIYVEYDLNNPVRLDFSKKTNLLLYGDSNRSFAVWESLPHGKEVRYLKIDVEKNNPVLSKTVPEE